MKNKILTYEQFRANLKEDCDSHSLKDTFSGTEFLFDKYTDTLMLTRKGCITGDFIEIDDMYRVYQNMCLYVTVRYITVVKNYIMDFLRDLRNKEAAAKEVHHDYL